MSLFIQDGINILVAIISYPKMKITEIEVFKHFPTAHTPSRLKGSVLRSNNQAKPVHPIHSEELILNKNLAIIQSKNQKLHSIIPSEQVNSLQMTPPKNQRKRDHQLAKTISVMVDKQRNYACLSARAATPTMAKHFSQTQSQYERKTTQSSSKRVVKTVDRYINFQAQDDGECRLSLSHFQAKVKSAISARAAKTQQQIISLKLEGTNYKITTKCTHSDQKAGKTLDKSDLFERRPHVYLTQDHSELTKILKQENNQNPNVHEFRQIMSKIHVETDKPSMQIHSYTKQLRPKHKKLYVHSASVPTRNKIGRQVETAREHAKVNVINIIEEGPVPYKRSCHQIFAKYFKKPQDKLHQDEKEARPVKPQDFFGRIELVEELRQIKKQINLRKSVSQKPTKSQEKDEKYTTNFIEEKLKKRKSLIEHYTFKKAAVQDKIQRATAGVQDFHVNGWEMIDQKQMITS